MTIFLPLALFFLQIQKQDTKQFFRLQVRNLSADGEKKMSSARKTGLKNACATEEFLCL